MCKNNTAKSGFLFLSHSTGEWRRFFYLFIYESGEYIKVKPHFSQGLVPLMHDKRDLGARLAAFYREMAEWVGQKRKEVPLSFHEESRDQLLAYLYMRGHMPSDLREAMEDAGWRLEGQEAHLIDAVEQEKRTFFSNREVLQNQRFSFDRKQWVRQNQLFFTNLLGQAKHI
ncbi:Pyruvate kinase [Geobacillus stearothermophilus]|uniref:hypothetical protein n=1 Tax=Geobacillus stearothermophilus TaxID=1422 RepID=UPI0007D926FE|nr:hypothetical protein [Geobacillus stearothermophilus]OAO83382.1 Pyruvate kinase [Geobacillus stearothermophilus]